MKKYNHKKKYGQNFLDSKDLLENIRTVINLNKEVDNVIEIGPGQGYLTDMLIENAKSLVSYEIDKDLIPYLSNRYKDKNNFLLINQDFMTVDIKGENNIVVANIPYYITSPIIEKLLSNRDKISSIYLMVQKEVAERICANKSKNVSILTHAVNFYAKASYLFTVDKELFDPIPKVDSAFIKLQIRKDKKYENMIDDKKYFKFLKLAFSNKRKTLVNNLSSIINKEKLQNLLSNKNIRAEQLSIEEFITLIKEIDNDRV